MTPALLTLAFLALLFCAACWLGRLLERRRREAMHAEASQCEREMDRKALLEKYQSRSMTGGYVNLPYRDDRPYEGEPIKRPRAAEKERLN